jgi:hypothetical protein
MTTFLARLVGLRETMLMFSFAKRVLTRCRTAAALTAVIAGCVATAAVAQSIDYPDFSDPVDLRLVGDAALVGDRLRLTPAAYWQTGGAWHTSKQNVADAWETYLTFQSSTRVSSGADGFALVIQNSSLDALGTSGPGLGYDGISNSLAIEFDMWNNGEGSQDHVSVHSQGISANSYDHSLSLGSSSNIPSLRDGAVHTVRIIYDPGSVFIYIDDMETPRLVVPVDLTDLLALDNGTAWVGLTAATGGAYQNHDISLWRFGPRDGSGTPFIALVEPGFGAAIQTGSTAIAVTVAMLGNLDGHWHWSLDSPFADAGLAGGTMVATGATTTIDVPGGLQDGASHTVYVVPVDASHQVVGPQSRVTFTVANGVSIPDPALLAAIRSAVGRPTGIITEEDMASLEGLDTSGGVRDLAGIEHGTNVTWLVLRNNYISDLGPLATLTGLEGLWIEGNAISDFPLWSTFQTCTRLNSAIIPFPTYPRSQR